MWIDRKCRINVGKFKGRHGRVLRSGNGWVQLRLHNSNENTAKRAYELTLLEDLETINELYAKTLALQKKRAAEGGDANGHDTGDPDDDDDDDKSEDDTRSGTEDNATAAEQTEDSQGEESSGSGKRSRRLSTRGSYAISWIERKVHLPGRKGTGTVKRADRETCTVEVGTSKVLKVFKKKDLELIDDAAADASKGSRQNNRNRSNNAKAKDRLGLPDGVTLMGTTPARYAAFQDQVKKFIMRKREKIKKRPNLQAWQAQINLKLLETGARDEDDPNVVDLFVVPSCDICGVEKEVRLCVAIWIWPVAAIRTWPRSAHAWLL